MRTLKSQGLVHDQNYAKFPEGTIVNETDQVEGTPVVREVYGDTLTNIYAILKDRGINANNLEDNEQNGYQLLQALRRVFNEFSDSIKILSKNASDWSIPIDYSLIPDGLILFVRSTDQIDFDSTIQVKDLQGSIFNTIAKSDVKTGDDCILILDGNDSRIYGIGSSQSEASQDSFATFGFPLQRLDSVKKLWYHDGGILSQMLPEFHNLNELIQAFTGNPQMQLKAINQIEDKFLCLIYNAQDYRYSFLSIDESMSINSVSVSGINISDSPSNDLSVYFYSDSTQVFLTNNAGNDADDTNIASFSFNPSTSQLTYQNSFTLHTDFEKNSNTIVDGIRFIYLNQDGFNIFDNSGSKSVIETFGKLQGQIFRANSKNYYNDGFNAKSIII